MFVIIWYIYMFDKYILCSTATTMSVIRHLCSVGNTIAESCKIRFENNREPISRGGI